VQYSLHQPDSEKQKRSSVRCISYYRTTSLDRVALVYPSKALLQDQLGRVLEHLHTIKTTTDEQLLVGVWSGDTAYKPEDVSTEDALFEGAGQRKRFRLANCWCGDHQDPHAFHYEGVAVTTTSSVNTTKRTYLAIEKLS